MKAVILAGGRGTRLGDITTKMPKPLVPVVDRPILEHQLLFLAKNQVTEVIISVKYLSDMIKHYIGDGSRWKLHVTYSEEPYEPLGTAGALKLLEPQLTEDFLLLYADIMMNFDLHKFIAFHYTKPNAFASMVVVPTNFPYERDLVEIDDKDQVKTILSKPHAPHLLFRNHANLATYILSPQVFPYIPIDTKLDLVQDIFPKILHEKQAIYAYPTNEYLEDIGTPSSLDKVSKDYASGKIALSSKQNQRRAVFIDQDGVISKNHDRKQENDWSLYAQALTALHQLNQSEYLTILFDTKDAGTPLKEQRDREKQLQTSLAKKGIKLDALYYQESMTHDTTLEHLIAKAAQEHNINLSQSYLIGDTTIDIETARRTKVASILVHTGHAGNDGSFSTTPDHVVKNLKQAIQLILQKSQIIH